ncbi:RNA polymerase sigma factor [Lutibacter flavus]|uniref:RNA polymerase sigma-70 factor, ECF subfamily n=1 Tax=Lutibacter flavus TaxID=691689 RepID=A0A238YKR2_9FLAO|nr:sigma-70 family RNA polymerase sigma factor [Lutibacter flavus]SNR71388.1 RNA polymerase sigma-70 factor, ECF subfamily [Lutibacter flavus]
MQKQKEFIKVIKENEGIIFKITLVYSSNEEDQKDLYQEIVYQLWKSFDSFRGNSKISTWLYRIALNTSITYLKKEKRNGNRVSLNSVLSNKIDQLDTIMEERIKVLYAQIKKLNTIEKGVILLYLEGKNYQEIGVITGFTVSNVGTRLNRIKQKLKEQIIK